MSRRRSFVFAFLLASLGATASAQSPGDATAPPVFGTPTDPAAAQSAPAPQVYEQQQQPTYAAPPMYAAPAPMETRLAPNALYVELLGNGGFYTLNYERRFIEDLSARIGFGFISVSATAGSASSRASVMSIPLMANYLGIGNDRHHLELGAGLILVYASAATSSADSIASGSAFGVGGTATVGYRYQPRDGGFLFRVGFTPQFGAGGFQAWGGLSLGGAF